jgi:molecular chaperone GrpE
VSDQTDIDERNDADAGAGPPQPAPDDAAPELDGHLRRALADLDNLRKRFDREVSRERSAERARVASMWLPVVDDLERALQHAGTDTESVIEGIRAVRAHALAVLERLGFPSFDDIGEQFDPQRHEALATVHADAPAGTIVATARPGYGTGDQVLRPAGVIVAKERDSG